MERGRRIPISPYQCKTVVRRYVNELTVQGRFEVAEEILAADAAFYGPGQSEPVRGRTAFIDFLRALREAFPDLYLEIHAELCEADMVAIWLTVHGTHCGTWRGVEPAGGQLALRAMNLFRFSGGRIAEVHAFFNVADYVHQLGGSGAQGRGISSDEQDALEDASQTTA